jgi:hypothetical protein
MLKWLTVAFDGVGAPGNFTLKPASRILELY